MKIYYEMVRDSFIDTIYHFQTSKMKDKNEISWFYSQLLDFLMSLFAILSAYEQKVPNCSLDTSFHLYFVQDRKLLWYSALYSKPI